MVELSEFVCFASRLEFMGLLVLITSAAEFESEPRNRTKKVAVYFPPLKLLETRSYEEVSGLKGVKILLQ